MDINKKPIIQQIGLAMQPIALLVLRVYVASVFLRSGVQKLTHWDGTLFLFEYQYTVPLLAPNVAAVLGASAEIILPILLLFGVLSRWSAISLFVFNIIAVSSYAVLSKGSWGLTTVFDVIPTGVVFPTKGYEDHVVWGVMIFVIFACGAGKISVDGLLSLRNTHINNDRY